MKEKIIINSVTLLIVISIFFSCYMIYLSTKEYKGNIIINGYEDKIFILEKRIAKHDKKIREIENKFSHLTISKKLTITAYNPVKEQTNLQPTITASMRLIKPGMVAVSRDLFYSGWSFGKKVYIERHGVFEIQDLMNERYKDSMDILMYHKGDAKRFGRKVLRVILMGRVE